MAWCECISVHMLVQLCVYLPYLELACWVLTLHIYASHSRSFNLKQGKIITVWVLVQYHKLGGRKSGNKGKGSISHRYCDLSTSYRYIITLCILYFTHRGGLFGMVQQPLLILPHLEWKVPWNLLEWLVSPLHVESTSQGVAVQHIIMFSNMTLSKCRQKIRLHTWISKACHSLCLQWCCS